MSTMSGASMSSFAAAAEPEDVPDHYDRLREQRALAPRLSCCGRYAKRATITHEARYANDGYYEDFTSAVCPRHGKREIMEVS